MVVNITVVCKDCGLEFNHCGRKTKTYCKICCTPQACVKRRCKRDIEYKLKRQGYKIQKGYKQKICILTEEQLIKRRLQNQRNAKNRVSNGKQKITRKNYYLKNNTKRIESRLRSRIWYALTKQKTKKNTSFNELLGCNASFLKLYLEKQFQKGMTWNNYGINGWHIDHKIPCSKFDLTRIEEQKKCFHYSNLQPLWAGENHVKHDKILVTQLSLLI